MELLEITRKYNYFEFGENLYKQEGGTNIGKKHAPETACLGAGKLEEEQIFASDVKHQKMKRIATTKDLLIKKNL